MDPVFGVHSTLLRAEWEKKVLENVQWIFDSNKVREKIYGMGGKIWDDKKYVYLSYLS